MGPAKLSWLFLPLGEKMNLDTYYPKIRIISNSALGGKQDRFEDYDNSWFNNIPTVKAWLEDNDLQELTVCSGNIGFVYTFRKFYKEQEEKILELMLEVETKNENNK